MRIHHIGIATDNIEKAKQYVKYFVDDIVECKEVYDPLQQAKLCMLTTKQGIGIELVEGEVVSKLVKKRQYLYHVCYEVDDIYETIKELTDSGGLVISEPKEAVLFNNRKVAFIMSDLGIVEILEKS